MKKSYVMAIIILLVLSVPALYAGEYPKIEVFARGSKMLFWEETNIFGSNPNPFSRDRANAINFLINEKYHFKIILTWPFKKNLGFYSEEYYFDRVVDVIVFIRLLNGFVTGIDQGDN